jgi:hypothetical protein
MFLLLHDLQKENYQHRRSLPEVLRNLQDEALRSLQLQGEQGVPVHMQGMWRVRFGGPWLQELLPWLPGDRHDSVGLSLWEEAVSDVFLQKLWSNRVDLPEGHLKVTDQPSIFVNQSPYYRLIVLTVWTVL